MTVKLPASVLFCCNFNAVRSPMAEGIMKKYYGDRVYVQSAGVAKDMEIDGFAIAVCSELGIELSRHRTRVMKEGGMLGEDLSSFETIVAMTPEAHEVAIKSSEYHAIDVEFWPISDPTTGTGRREDRLEHYRRTRDEIVNWILSRYSCEKPLDGPT